MGEPVFILAVVYSNNVLEKDMNNTETYLMEIIAKD